MECFFPACATGLASLRASKILRTWQFIASEVQDIVLCRRRWLVGPHARDFCGQHDRQDEQDRFTSPRYCDTAEGPQAGLRFPGQRSWRAAERRADRSAEFLPPIRPLDQKFEIVAHPEIFFPFILV
jgi:hypothetical protein